MAASNLLPKIRWQRCASALAKNDPFALSKGEWALRSNYSAAQLKDTLREYIDRHDRIVVTKVGTEWASRRALSNLAEL